MCFSVCNHVNNKLSTLISYSSLGPLQIVYMALNTINGAVANVVVVVIIALYPSLSLKNNKQIKPKPPTIKMVIVWKHTCIIPNLV